MGTRGHMPPPLSPGGCGGLHAGHLVGTICTPVSLRLALQGKPQSTSVKEFDSKRSKFEFCLLLLHWVTLNLGVFCFLLKTVKWDEKGHVSVTRVMYDFT